MTNIVTIFFIGISTQLCITIISIMKMNNTVNRYPLHSDVYNYIHKYVCEALICCILIIIGYLIFTGMIIENIIKYEFIASIVNLLFFSCFHISFQYMYHSKIKDMIHNSERVAPEPIQSYVNSPQVETNVITMTTNTYIQDTDQTIQCTYLTYNPPQNPITVIHPDGTISVVNPPK